MPKFLIIAKPVQLDKNGVVIPGQCLPGTDGWRLIEYESDDKSEQPVFAGYYDHCRRIQTLLSDNRNADISAELSLIDAETEKRRASSSSFLKRITRAKKETSQG